MRLLGLLAIFGSAFAFMAAWKGVHDALPQLIADTTMRVAVEKCVTGAFFMLIIGGAAVTTGLLFFYEAEVGNLVKHAQERENQVRAEIHAVAMRVEQVHREALGRDTNNLTVLSVTQTGALQLAKKVQAIEAKFTAQPASPNPPTT